MNRTALIQVLGAVAYGELKAYEGAQARARQAATEEERKAYRKVAAEELRHHKGFRARLEALGADPERAMRPYRASLDRYHGGEAGSPIEEAVWSYLGEGVADDLLEWLRKVVDPDTAAFIDTVIADEEEHEAMATAELRSLLSGARERQEAGRAAQRMALHMLDSGRTTPLPFAAFVRLGRPLDLIGAILGGHLRRMRAIGVGPMGLPLPAVVARSF
jgi:rubrerythrin